jgi:hypothetical protein
MLLSPSIAKEILKSQRSNAPSVATCGWSPFIKSPNGGRIPLNTPMKKARWRPDRDNIETTGSMAMKAVAAPRPSANASEFFPGRNKRKSNARLSDPQRPKEIRASSTF